MMRRSDIPRLFLRHSLPLIIFVLLFCLAVIGITGRFVSQHNFSQASQMLSQATVYYDSILEEIAALNLIFSTNNDAIRVLRSVSDMSADYDTYRSIRLLTSFLTATVSSQRYIESIYIFIMEQEGFVVNEAGLIPLETSPDREWFSDYLASPPEGIRTEVIGDGRVIRISQPIRNTMGERAGVIAIDLDADSLKDDFVSYFSYSSIYLTVRNSEGDILFSTLPSGIDGRLEHFSNISEAYGWVYDLYIDKGELYNLSRTIVMLTLVLGILIAVTGIVISYRMDREEREFMEALVSGLSGSGRTELPKSSAGGFYRQLTVSVLDEFMQNKYLKLQKEVADYRALQMQINPHFLFNTLDNIYWKTIRLAGGENDAGRMIMLLSSLFKASLTVDALHGIPLADELEHARTYIRLQEYRFRGRFRYVEDIGEGIDAKVPNMLLQPILENAISHGMVEGEMLTISLDVHMDGNVLRISVYDDGKPMDAEALARVNDAREALNESRSIGLRNIRDRLRIFSQGGAVLSVSSDGARGVTVTIAIPC